MKKEQIAALLSLGFTFEELFNKGIIVPASDAGEKQKSDADAGEKQKSDADAGEKQKSDADAVIAAINGMRNDIIKTVQQINAAAAERGGDKKVMTVDEALDGIVKGV